MRSLPFISGLFVAILLISGIVSTKIIAFWPFSFDGGTLLFPLSYIFGDVLTEVYGYKESRKIIWTWLISMVLMSMMIMIVGGFPAAGDRWFQSDYEHILMLTPRIFAASIIAYFVGEFLNSYVLAKLKIFTNGSKLRTRTIGSTLVGELVDTILFVLIAFYGALDPSLIWTLIISNYIFKVGVEILFTPLTYRIINTLKKYEHTDVYDRDTNFNPFKL